MFRVTVDNDLLYPNPASDLVSSSHLTMFEFMGRLLGKALYESTLVEPVFASFFLNKLLDRPNYVDDLRSLDYDLHKNLLSITQLEDVSTLDLTFSVLEDRLGAQMDVPLIPNGENIFVTNSNRHRYIASMAYYYLHDRIRSQTSAFRRGLNKLVPVGWIRMFNSKELQLLIGGSSSDFDVNDMKRHSNCSNGYHPDQPYIQSFWKIVDDFDSEDRAKFLRFVTSCSRPPLLGFRKLHPKFCIQQIRVQTDSDRLPIAATCMNLLKLPKYSSPEVMKEKILLAINEGQGFTLT
jgi:ubiquitin-protein ligase E3 C